MQIALTDYLQYLAIERQVSTNTLASYKRDIQKIIALCGPIGVLDWSELTTQQLRTFIA